MTVLKVKMKKGMKQARISTNANGEPKVNSPPTMNNNNNTMANNKKTNFTIPPKPALRVVRVDDDATTLDVPMSKHVRRLSDSLDVDKPKRAPRVRRRSVSFDPFTVFKTAILDNDVDTTKNVLVSGKVDANTSVDGVLPILIASKDGCAECLQLLIDHGAEIDVHDKNGLSPLELAVREGQFDCAQILISAGANANCIRDGYFDDSIEKVHRPLSGGRSRSRTF